MNWRHTERCLGRGLGAPRVCCAYKCGRARSRPRTFTRPIPAHRYPKADRRKSPHLGYRAPLARTLRVPLNDAHGRKADARRAGRPIHWPIVQHQPAAPHSLGSAGWIMLPSYRSPAPRSSARRNCPSRSPISACSGTSSAGRPQATC
jgi:hypothetical protein